MSNYNNMSDADLLSVLNSMADEFEQKTSGGFSNAQNVFTKETAEDNFNSAFANTGYAPFQPINDSHSEPEIIDVGFKDNNGDYDVVPVQPVQTQPIPVQPVRRTAQFQDAQFTPVEPTPQSVEPQPVNVENWEDMEITLEDTPGYAGSTYAEPEQDMPVVNPVYTFDKDGNIVFSNMRPTQQSNAFRITPEKAVTATSGLSGFLEKRRQVLFESEFGTSYTYKKSWEEILKAVVAEFKDARAVNNFGVKDGLVLAKNLEVDPSKFTDDKLGITLYDLINFHVLFKELPNIEMLVLDSLATERMVITYGDKANDIWKVFQECPTLRILRIHTSTGWKDHNRSDFGATAVALEQELQEARAKAELQYKFDVINPRKSEMTKGYAYRVKENAKEMRNHSFGVAKEAFMAPKPKLFSSLLYGGIGIGLAGIGAVSSVLHGIKLLTKPR